MDSQSRRKRLLGRLGELAAVAWLVLTGHRILARNWRCRRGEIDIVARRREVVVFVEVRTRRRGALVNPLLSVDPAKRSRILGTARLFLAARGLSNEPCRFDVVAVTVSGWLPVRLRHVRRAFDGDTPARNGSGCTAGRGRGWSRG